MISFSLIIISVLEALTEARAPDFRTADILPVDGSHNTSLHPQGDCTVFLGNRLPHLYKMARSSFFDSTDFRLPHLGAYQGEVLGWSRNESRGQGPALVLVVVPSPNATETILLQMLAVLLPCQHVITLHSTVRLPAEVIRYWSGGHPEAVRRLYDVIAEGHVKGKELQYPVRARLALLWYVIPREVMRLPGRCGHVPSGPPVPILASVQSPRQSRERFLSLFVCDSRRHLVVHRYEYARMILRNGVLTVHFFPLPPLRVVALTLLLVLVVCFLRTFRASEICRLLYFYCTLLLVVSDCLLE